MIAPAQLYSIKIDGENAIVITVDRIDENYWFVSLVYDAEEVSKKPVLKDDIPLGVCSFYAEKWNVFPVHSELLNSFIVPAKPRSELNIDEMLMTFPIPEDEEQRKFILSELDRAHKIVDASLQLEMSKTVERRAKDGKEEQDHYRGRIADDGGSIYFSRNDPNYAVPETDSRIFRR